MTNLVDFTKKVNVGLIDAKELQESHTYKRYIQSTANGCQSTIHNTPSTQQRDFSPGQLVLQK